MILMTETIVRTLDSTVLHVVRTRLVTDYPNQIRECVAVLDEAQLWWRPNEQANAIGNLILHLAGSTRFYIAHAIGGAAFNRDRDAEFAAREPVSRPELMRRFDEVWTEVERVLGTLDPARLMETTDRTGKSTTHAQILLHVLGHVATHTGQIVYATKLLKAGAIHELWQKTRS
jgi:uncharacterized damage-inducible protein DinB